MLLVGLQQVRFRDLFRLLTARHSRAPSCHHSRGHARTCSNKSMTRLIRELNNVCCFYWFVYLSLLFSLVWLMVLLFSICCWSQSIIVFHPLLKILFAIDRVIYSKDAFRSIEFIQQCNLSVRTVFNLVLTVKICLLPFCFTTLWLVWKTCASF